MIKMNKIHNILDEIGKTTKINEKIKILENEKDNELLKKIFFYTYNPYYQYYIKKIPKLKSHKDVIEFKKVFELLDNLRYRKITGNEARDMVLKYLSELNEKDASLLEKIIKKDLKIGVNKKLINKVWDGLIPEIPYMGAVPYDEKKINKLFEKYDLIYSQVKYDGMFCNLIVDFKNKVVKTISRNGKELFLDKAFLNILDKVDNSNKEIVLTGELLVEGFDRYKANGLLNSLKIINEKIVNGTLTQKDYNKFIKEYGEEPENLMNRIYMVAWDIIPYEFWIQSRYEELYSERLKQLERITEKVSNINFVEYKIVKNKSEALNHFKELLNKGMEGSILKGNDIWKNGKPTYNIKQKIVMELDFVIVGLHYGNEGTAYENYINRIEAVSKDGKINAMIAGIDENMMKKITQEKDKLIGKVVTLECSGLSWVDGKAKAVLHPRFKEIRYDKNKKDANDYNDCVEIEKSKLNLN
jgi:ATP-dependent DNA ligase